MEEPPLLLRWAMFHFAGCEAFLAGLALFCAAQVLLMRQPIGRTRTTAVIAARLGLIWAFAVPAPVPRWLLLSFAASLVGLALAARQASASTASASDKAKMARSLSRWRCLVVGCAAALILSEVSHRLSPRLSAPPERLLIAADSVTAGLNDGEDTWPQRLAREVPLEVFDASQPGATLKSAVEQVALFDEQPSLLLLEIGGNDLLEGLPVAQFQHDMDRLLAAATRPGRTVWMFELPLPPLAFRYGEAQRQLARRHGVTLIPRQYLLRVLTSPGGTVDGIHLSSLGHQRMAELMQSLLNLDSLKKSGRFQRLDAPR